MENGSIWGVFLVVLLSWWGLQGSGVWELLFPDVKDWTGLEFGGGGHEKDPI